LESVISTVFFCQGDEEQTEAQPRNAAHHIHSAHSLFPSSLCSAVIQIINLLDDAAVSPDGNAVYEVAYQVLCTAVMLVDSEIHKSICYTSIGS
jgi:hypothetical protein